MSEYTAKDFKKGQPRWCPGCGDHFFLNSLHKALAESVLSLGNCRYLGYRLLQPSALLYEYVCDADYPRTCCRHLYRM